MRNLNPEVTKSPKEYQDRLALVRENLAAWQIEALLVTNITNCRWLTGFTGSAATVLISEERALLATDSRYWEQAELQAVDYELFRHQRITEDTERFLRTVSAHTIGLEANHVTLQQAQEYQSVNGIQWKPLVRPLEQFRAVKTAAEIAAISAAAAITDKAMSTIVHMLHPGLTERELAWALEKDMREHGAEGMAFPPIVAFGPHSARPHHTPGSRQLAIGDIVLIDMGAKHNGYCSDLTRTFYFGETPPEQFVQVYQTVLLANNQAVDGIKPGITTREAHHLAANVIEAQGFGQFFGHGLGHGIGIEIHEDPFLSATRAEQLIAEGMVITIEPGIYIPGWGGVRIEDLALVTPSGTRLINAAIKEPLLDLRI